MHASVRRHRYRIVRHEPEHGRFLTALFR